MRLTYSLGLTLAGGGIDGLDGADKLCVLAAASVELGGQWKAWLSTSEIDAIDRIQDVGPWENLRGEIIFFNKATILTGPLNEVLFDERNEDTRVGALGASPISEYWTGTGRSGRRYESAFSSDASCADWTLDEQDPRVSSQHWSEGLTGWSTGTTWTEGPEKFCHYEARVLCFEQ